MKQIVDNSDLISYTKLYLIQWVNGAEIATYTPKHDDCFTTMGGDVVPTMEVTCIVELCDNVE